MPALEDRPQDQVNACAANVPVKVQHLVNGTWRNEASLETNASGDFHVGGMTTVGRYRAVAKRVTLGGTDICEKAISPTVRQ